MPNNLVKFIPEGLKLSSNIEHASDAIKTEGCDCIEQGASQESKMEGGSCGLCRGTIQRGLFEGILSEQKYLSEYRYTCTSGKQEVVPDIH